MENCGKSLLKVSDLGCVINSAICVTEQTAMDVACAMQLLMCLLLALLSINYLPASEVLHKLCQNVS